MPFLSHSPRQYGPIEVASLVIRSQMSPKEHIIGHYLFVRNQLKQKGGNGDTLKSSNTTVGRKTEPFNNSRARNAVQAKILASFL